MPLLHFNFPRFSNLIHIEDFTICLELEESSLSFTSISKSVTWKSCVEIPAVFVLSALTLHRKQHNFPPAFSFFLVIILCPSSMFVRYSDPRSFALLHNLQDQPRGYHPSKSLPITLDRVLQPFLHCSALSIPLAFIAESLLEMVEVHLLHLQLPLIYPSLPVSLHGRIEVHVPIRSPQLVVRQHLLVQSLKVTGWLADIQFGDIINLHSLAFLRSG